MRSSEIRSKFLKYFEGKGHTVLPGSSLIPKDPTVLLTLAGMLQFKPIFLGLEKPQVSRAATVQKCIRTNDIENVGHTARHHTFFEMLGNFSFGDYFKDDAISFAWELLSKEFNLDKKKLWIAVYEKDDESLDIWTNKIGAERSRIVKLGEDNNFWAAGPTGPCGPCSEIYYDLGEKYGCGKKDCSPGCDCDRFLEIWNLVFMEFNRDEKGTLSSLPKKNIDTGMGLERITSVLQGVSSNFETDLFVPIINKVCDISSISEWKNNPSVKIIADHTRAAAFLISDGLVPGNEGRNYVLRRIIRRAVIHGRKIGIKGMFLSDLAGTVEAVMGDFYRDLSKDLDHISKTIKIEEESFGKTIETGMEILESVIRKAGGGVISGQDAFKLYDTYGFPIEMTKEMAQERGLLVDMDGFESAMLGQKERSKQSSKKYSLGSIPQIKGYPATKFEGYDYLETQSTVLAVVDDYIILDKSPFYVESGGQDSDRGWLVIEKNKVYIKLLAKTAEGVVLHKTASDIHPMPGEKIRAIVNKEIREMIAAHHTSTHLLHAALHKVVGEHATQKGSFVGSDKFRMDFTSAEALKAEELKQIEDIVNDAIQKAINVTTIITTPEEAKKMGAMALFGEKYGDSVRMIEIKGVSRELCGGTHVKNTSEIGLFKIIRETAIAQGIRRIEAVSGIPAEEYIKHKEIEGNKIKLAQEQKEQEKLAERAQKEEALAIKETLLTNAADIKGISFVSHEFKAFKTTAIKKLLEEMINRQNTIVVFTSVFEDKVSVICGVSTDLIKKGFHAGNMIKELAAIVGGGGGGRDNCAEAGGKDVSGKGKIFDKAKEILLRK
ncbi:MAG: alanine--tRNA ligase [Candidatus Margulisiibacteriota bacterium]